MAQSSSETNLSETFASNIKTLLESFGDEIEGFSFDSDSWNQPLDGESGNSMKKLFEDFFEKQTSDLMDYLFSSKIKTGTASHSGTSTTVSGFAYDSATYKVIISPRVAGEFWVSDKNLTSFKINSTSSVVGYVDWVIING